MSRSIRKVAVLSLAVAASFAVAKTSFAGCHSHRPVHHVQHYHHPVVRHHVVRPIIHVTQPPVVIAPPAPPVEQLPSVPSGATLTLPGNFLGPVAGHVFLVFENVKLPAQIDDWNPNGVTITLPPMAVKQPTPARIDVLLPQGQAMQQVKILLTPPAPLVLHASAPASPLPTGPMASAPNGPPQLAGPIMLQNQQ